MRAAVLLALAACERGHVVPSQASAPPAEHAASAPVQAADAGAVERYFRQEWGFTSDDGTVRFEAHGRHCMSMPAEPPAGATLTLTRMNGETMTVEYFGVTASYPCRFGWGMPWSPPPRGACMQMTAQAFVETWRELRDLDLGSIRTRAVADTSPHRGGWSVGVRFPGSECEVADRGESHVAAEDLARFDRARQVVARAFDGTVR